MQAAEQNHTGSNDRIIYIFILAALAVRLVFWLYTGRIWEDAMITITPAMNVWDGVGLTHHASEPRVHSFTSPVSVLVPLLGGFFEAPLLFLRLSCLLATVGTIIMAYRICRMMNFAWPGTVFALSFLSFNYMQIFFGMGGMETQMATCALMAACYYFMASRWTALGVALGFCMLCRPDFFLPCAVIGLWLIVAERKHFWRVFLIALAVYSPWLLFTLIYYGSPIPHTIIAKSQISPNQPVTFQRALTYISKNWRVYAPFLEMHFARLSGPLIFLKAIVLIELILVVIGLFYGTVRQRKFLIIALIVLVFTYYKATMLLKIYYMWYLVPFMGLTAILIAAGLDAVAKKKRPLGAVMAVVLIVAVMAPLPVHFELDRRVQRDVEEAVRRKVGERLNELAAADDTIVLEPLGYIGYYARNKTIYDFPGLGSNVSVEALSGRYRRFSTFVKALKPDFAVLRPMEVLNVATGYPEFETEYEIVEEIKSPNLDLTIGPFSYFNGDSHFIIWKKKSSQSSGGRTGDTGSSPAAD